jgi:hypothetical protein
LKAAFIGNPLTLAITAIATAVGIFVARQVEAEQRVQSLTDTLDQQTAAITENTRAHVYSRLEQDGVIAKAKELGLALDVVVDAALGGAAAQKQLNDEYEVAAARTRELARGGLGAFADGTAEATRRSMLYKDVLVEVGGVSDDVTESQRRVRDQIAAGVGVTDSATAATGRQVDVLKELTDAQDEAAGAAISQREAQIRATEAQEAATRAAQEGATVARDQSGAVDLNAASTIAADKALLGLVGAQNTLTDAMRRNNTGAAELDATVRQQRDAFVQAAQQMGYTKTEAENLAAAYGLIPSNVYTQVVADAAAAQRTINQLIELNNGRKIVLTVDASGNTTGFRVPGTNVRGNHHGAVLDFFERGGFHGLTPMGAVAQMVPPNTWRVVGDRPDVPEAYIPLNRSVRSLAILDEAAARLGRRVVPMADGGVTAAPPVPSAPAAAGPVAAAFTDAQVERLAHAFERGATRSATGVLERASADMAYEGRPL